MDRNWQDDDFEEQTRYYAVSGGEIIGGGHTNREQAEGWLNDPDDLTDDLIAANSRAEADETLRGMKVSRATTNEYENEV